MTHQRVYLSIGVLCAGSLVAATKLRDWKTGTVIDTVIEREQPNGPVAIASSGGSTTGDMALAAAMARKPVVREGLVIKGEGYGFMVAYVIRWHKANVTIHGAVKYAVEKGGKFYVLDDDGREFRMMILKKMLLPAEPKAQAAPVTDPK